MALVPNPNGRGFIEVSEEQNQQLAAMQAAAAPPQPEGPIAMIGSDGKTYDVPPASYKTALEQGWKPFTEQAAEREKEITRRVDATSQIEGGIKTFVNELGMGIPDYVAKQGSSPELASINEEVKNRVAGRDPITHGAAWVAGNAALLAVPGVGEVGAVAKGAVLGERALARGAAEIATKTVLEEGIVKTAVETTMAKAAEAGLGRKIAASAADFATQGAIYSAPKAVVQVAYGDVEQAAETMAIGIAFSGGLGVGAGLLGAGVKAGARVAVEGAESLSTKLAGKQANGISYLDDISRNFLGITDKQALKLGPEKLTSFVERADQLGILQSGNKVKAATELLDSSGAKIGEHLEKLEAHLTDPEVKKLVTAPIDVANEIQKTAMEKFPEIMMETHSAQLKELSKIINDVGAGGAEASFEKLQGIRQGIAKGRKAFDKGTPNAELYRFADGVIQKHLEAGAEAVYVAGKEPAAFAEYMQNKFDYHMATELLKNENPFKGTGRLPGKIENFLGHGSSVVNLGLGIAMGHGGIAGLTVAAKYAVNKLLKNEAFMGNTISTVRKLSKDPNSVPIIGGLLAKEGQAAFTAHLDSIPALLTSKPMTLGSTKAVSAFLGDEATGLSKDQQFKRMSDKITALMSNQAQTADEVGKIASVFSSTSVQLSSLVAQKRLDAIGYLASQLPRNPNGPQPFQKDTWKPNKQDQLIFERKLGIVMNPMDIWAHIKDHTITQADVDCLRTVHPKVYNAMVAKTVQTAYDPNLPPVDHKTAVAVSRFTGMPLDPSLKNLAAIQQAISAPIGSKPATPRAPKPSSRPKFDHAPTLTTDVQRRTYGKGN